MRPLHDPSSIALTQLAEQLHGIEQRRGSGGDDHTAGRIATGWAEIDRTLGGGLPRSVVHEWFGHHGPPLCIVAHLAGRALMEPWGGTASEGEERAAVGRAETSSVSPCEAASGWTVWIGRAIWPYPHILARAGPGLLDRSIWLDPVNEDDRLWAIDQAVRCPGVSIVIADGVSLTMAATRRLQLAAKTGEALVLLLRPARELAELSAAGLRWRVAPAPSANRNPRWTVELLRAKGAALAGDGSPKRWLLERNHAEGLIHLSAELGDGTGAEEGIARMPRRRIA